MALSSDRVLRRAVNEFASNERPSNSDIVQFSALFCGHFGLASSVTRMLCADVLAKCDTLSDEIINNIALDEPMIAARFIRISPALTTEKMAELSERMHIDQLRALARRPHLPKPVARQLRALGDNKINTALDLRQVAAPVNIVFHGNGRLTKDGFLEILDAAKARDLKTLCVVLAEYLSITQSSAFALLSDKRSSNLIIALKHIGLGSDDAWSVYNLLAPAIANSHSIKVDFLASFDRYSAKECAQTVQNWIIDDLANEVLRPISSNDDKPTTDLIDQAVNMLKAG